MYLKRSVLSGFIGALLITGACRAAPEPKQAEQTKKAAPSENELVEIVIKMPDGRVIVRKERKSASRINSKRLLNKDGRPAVITKATSKGGSLNKLKSGASGGSNGSSGSSSSSASGGSGGGGGGGSAGGGGGGGASSGGHSGGAGGGDNRSQSGGSGGEDDANNDGDNDVLAVQPDDDYTVRMYAWENAGSPFMNVTKTYIADPRSKTPRRLAYLLSLQIEQDQPDQIILRFWKEFDPAVRHPFDHSDPLDLVESGGYTAGIEAYWNEFAIELARLGVEPDYLILDMEEGAGFWHIPIQDRQEFFNELMDPNRSLSPVLPVSMGQVTVDQFMNYRNFAGTVALNDYNQFAAQLRASLLKDVFSDAFESAYERYIPISNYADISPSFDLTRYTARPILEGTMAGISAPITYLDFRGEGATRYARTEKDRRWNRFIDALNRCRSASTTGLVTPWVSAPGYGRNGPDTWARPNELTGEYRIWELMMDHLLAMGIDTFILWNPNSRFNPSAVPTDAFLDQWLADHPVGAGPQLRDLSEIPLDADAVITNGVVTTYQDFLDALNAQ